MKAHIKCWVNERHNVVTAEDMKAALESCGGIKGCRAAVIKVNTTRERNKDNKIPGISVLNNFQYEEFDICVWTAYDIGLRRFIPYSGLRVTPQRNMRLRVIKPSGVAKRLDMSSCSRPKQRQTTIQTQASTVLNGNASPCMTALGGNGWEL